jgi:hypothetical protein
MYRRASTRHCHGSNPGISRRTTYGSQCVTDNEYCQNLCSETPEVPTGAHVDNRQSPEAATLVDSNVLLE